MPYLYRHSPFVIVHPPTITIFTEELAIISFRINASAALFYIK
jgi:hypothetical protein